MKTLLKLAATALLSWAVAAPALASPPPANLGIFSERGQYFSVLLDGRPLTRVATQQVRVGWLAPGRHYADINLATPYGPPMNFRTVVWLQPGRESDYLLVMRHWGPQLEPVAAAPGGPSYSAGGYYGGGNQGGYYNGSASGGYNPSSYPPDPNGGYDPNNYPPDPTSGYPAPPAPNGGYPPGGYPAPGTASGNYPLPATPANPSGGYSTPANPGGSYPAPAYPGNNGGPGYYTSPAGTTLRPLAPVEVASLAQAIRRASFDPEKLSIAKQGLSQSSVRAEDLAGLMKALSFSDARVDLATFGYSHVSDPQNFYLVYSSLEFSADVQKVRQNLNLP